MHVITIKRKGLQIPNILNSVRAVCSAFFFCYFRVLSSSRLSQVPKTCLKYQGCKVQVDTHMENPRFYEKNFIILKIFKNSVIDFMGE